jgi:hypothetical protein
LVRQEPTPSFVYVRLVATDTWLDESRTIRLHFFVRARFFGLYSKEILGGYANNRMPEIRHKTLPHTCLLAHAGLQTLNHNSHTQHTTYLQAHVEVDKAQGLHTFDHPYCLGVPQQGIPGVECAEAEKQTIQSFGLKLADPNLRFVSSCAYAHFVDERV